MGVEKRTGGSGTAVAFVVLGALVAVLAVTIQAWGFLVMGIGCGASGALTLIKRRHELAASE